MALTSQRTRTCSQAVVVGRKTVEATLWDIPRGARVVRRYNPIYMDDDIWLEWEEELTPEEVEVELLDEMARADEAVLRIEKERELRRRVAADARNALLHHQSEVMGK